jgi:very-short-patch-repair endonuclease
MRSLSPRTLRARELRNNATDAEKTLWSILRKRGVAGCKFRRQVPIDRFYVDFACVERKVVVELDGGQHADQAAYDANRTEILEACGWLLLRFWNHQVTENRDGVAAAIREALELARP